MLGDSCFLSTIFILLCLPVAYSEQPKALIASEGYHAVLSTIICVERRT